MCIPSSQALLLYLPTPTCRTPLHCAASCSNLEMVQYLIHNGASVFMKTVDGQTPLRVAFEEFEESGDTEGSAASECLDYFLCEWGGAGGGAGGGGEGRGSEASAVGWMVPTSC